VRPIAPVIALALLYGAVLAHWRGEPGSAGGPLSRVRIAAGSTGLAVLAVALGPPLDGSATNDLAAHMLQHVLLLSVVPPLLLVGRVPQVVAAAAPAGRRRLHRRLGAHVLDRPAFVVAVTMIAVVTQAVAFGLWHLPALYDAAVGNDAVHAAEHLTFLGVGCFFWWALLRLSAQLGPPAAVLALFLATLPATLLGALMTLSTTPWYPRYLTGTVTQAVTRQQLAGVVMWAVGGMVTVACAVVLFGGWLASLERAAPRLDWEPAP
jgi:putative membrane protein